MYVYPYDTAQQKLLHFNSWF